MTNVASIFTGILNESGNRAEISAPAAPPVNHTCSFQGISIFTTLDAISAGKPDFTGLIR